MNPEAIERLVGKLVADMRGRFVDELPTLALLFAASELWMERDSPNVDPADRRLLTARVVLDVLGLSDIAIERCRMQLKTNTDPVTLNRRH